MNGIIIEKLQHKILLCYRHSSFSGLHRLLQVLTKVDIAVIALGCSGIR